MADRGIDRNNQVEVHQCADRIVEAGDVGAQIYHEITPAKLRNLITIGELKTVPRYSRYLQQRLQGAGWTGPVTVSRMAGIARPGEAYPEALSAAQRGEPAYDLRVAGQVGDVRGDRVKARAEEMRQAQ